MLYSAEYTKVIQTIESNIPQFFEKNTQLQLAILKLNFLHLIMLDCNQETIIKYYNTNIAELIQLFPHWEQSQESLQCIMLNNEIVKSRYYQTKWEEIVRLILASFEKVFVSTLRFNSTKHTCKMTKDCLVCSEELFYNTNIQKINCFEDELWFNYTNFKQQNQANKTNQQNYDLFYNIYGYEQNADFDKYMANLNSSKQQNLFITDEEMCEDLNLEHYYINYYNNNMNNSTKKELDNIDINIAIPQSFQNQNQNLNENLTITKSMISSQDGEKKQKFGENKTKSEKTKEKEKIKYKIPFF